MRNVSRNSWKKKAEPLIKPDYLETVFFKVLGDLKEYHDDLTLVGGWLSFVYSRYLWNNPAVKTVTTSDIDFGVGPVSSHRYSKTIFERLSSLDYTERHIRMDRMYPVVLYKEGNVRLDFIAPPAIEKDVTDSIVGAQININRIERFGFLLKHCIAVTIRFKNETYSMRCPKPSAYLYHKAATFIEREDEQKLAKDLYYMYFILRYAPDMENIFKEIAVYRRDGYFEEVPKNLATYFNGKTGKGCLLVEKENGPDYYLDDLRQDIYERFLKFRQSM